MKIRITNENGIVTVKKSSVVDTEAFITMCHLNNGESTQLVIEAPLTITGTVNRNNTSEQGDTECIQ